MSDQTASGLTRRPEASALTRPSAAHQIIGKDRGNTLPAQQSREDRARFALARSASWIKCRDKATGRPVAFAVPSASQPGLYHLASTRGCDCADHRLRGSDCYHLLAVRIHVTRVTAQRKGVVA